MIELQLTILALITVFCAGWVFKPNIMKEDDVWKKRFYWWFTVCIFIVAIISSFSVGYLKGQIDMAEIGFEILDHIQINEVNFDINETELINTMIDRFQEDYNLNLSNIERLNNETTT